MEPSVSTPVAALVEAMWSLPPFRIFSQEDLQALAQQCAIRQAAAGEVLIREGEPSDNRVYFLLSGRVSVYANEKFILGLDRPGDIVGEMGLIRDDPRSATVTVDEPGTLLVISSALSAGDDEVDRYKFRFFFSRLFNEIMADKLRITTDRAKLYEDAILESREAQAFSSGLQRQLEHNLQQIRIFAHLVSSATDAILITHVDGTIRNANAAFLNGFSIPRKRAVGHPLSQLIAFSAAGPRGWEEVSRLARGDGWQGEVEVLGGPAGPVPAECSLSLIADQQQAQLAYAVVLRDIRPRKRYEARILAQAQELERANAELRTMDRLKDQFMALVSHELRTPLTSVIAYAEMLSMEDGVEPEEVRSFAGVIHAEAQRLAALVNKVLLISRIESGQAMWNFAPGQLAEQIDIAVAIARSAAQAKGLELRLVQAGTARRTTFDGEKIRDLLHELLDNAVTYSETGTITVTLRQEAHVSTICVADEGVGIPPAEQRSMFDKFRQLTAIENHDRGIGLGLPLCYLIVSAHGGELSLQSAPGNGTTVQISLPDEPVDSPAVPDGGHPSGIR
jgi:PAS domain S-box-containing protein